MLKARKCVREMREYDSPVDGPAAELRLDLNESTTGCSPRVLAKLNSMAAKTLALYTPREPGENAVAEFLGRKPSEVLLTNGADEGIDLMCRAYLEPDDEVVIMVPAFAMYEVFAQVPAAKIVRVPAGPEFSFPVQRMIDALTERTRIVVITNPNNPTGVAVSRAGILKVLEAAPHAAVLLDEPNLFIVRTFSKAYGLAGLRLGVLAGAEEHISVLRRMCSPFNVNAFAVECVAEALADRQFVADYVEQVRTSREWLRQQLESMGFKCWPSQANFVLCRFGDSKKAILAGLLARGISLRDRLDCEGCVRISIGTQAEMERVVSELKHVLSTIPTAKQVVR